MKKTRYIPYGYTIRNGRTIIDQTEAEVIRGIFNDYIAGASLKEIAESLTSKQIPYTEKTADWGKARIARIIENAKYIGDSEYDPIVEEDTYQNAIERKAANNKNQTGRCSHALSQVRSRVRCGKCGSIMTRTTSNLCRVRESWTCNNPECKYTLRISDSDLLDRIRVLINRVIQNTELMIPKQKNKDSPDSAVYKLQNEMQRELEKEHPSEEYVLERIRLIAAERYNSEVTTVMLAAQTAKKRAAMMTVQDEFNTEYFSDIVNTVFFDENGEIRIITKTDTEITERSKT